MLFTSHIFIFLFLPTALAVMAFAKNYSLKIQLIIMISISLCFYTSNSSSQVAVLIFSILVNHSLISFAALSKNLIYRNAFYIASIFINIIILAYYKYFSFILMNFEIIRYIILPLYWNGWGIEAWKPEIGHYLITNPWGMTGNIISIPLGLSFFTFQQIAYLNDLWSGNIKNHKFLDYCFCVTFFPHLVAGPIVNYSELLPQLENKNIFKFNKFNIVAGFALFIIGLAKKNVIADPLSQIANIGFDHASQKLYLSPFIAWTSAFAYSFQLYFDFSGYSDMAIGLAKMFSVDLPVNFLSPYKSSNIIEFWRSWHITLSRFLKQYIYIPLGGNRVNSYRAYLNLIIVMLIGGIWHGAGWTYIIWGVLHGTFLVINHMWQKFSIKYTITRYYPKWISWFVTFICVTIAWIFFRSNSIISALNFIISLLNFDQYKIFDEKISFEYLLLPLSAIISFFMPNSTEIMSQYKIGIMPSGHPIDCPKTVYTWRYTCAYLFITALAAGVAIFYQTELPQFLYWKY
jgi:alginate O-acetyltransferase complex protein AlgI